MKKILVQTCKRRHLRFAEDIFIHMEELSNNKNCICKRTRKYIIDKITRGEAVIATTYGGVWVGFCYIETFSDNYVTNSGLMVNPLYKEKGFGSLIKNKIFKLSRYKFPDSKIFGLTTSLPVMKINSRLGYKPVTYDQLSSDKKFWKGCDSCDNYNILLSKNMRACLCTAMLYDPSMDENRILSNTFSRIMYRCEEFMNDAVCYFLQ